MSGEDAPKSAYELAMERLRQKDREAGVEQKPISEEQRSAIAEIRRVYQAKLAEREIFHQSSLRQVEDFEAREKLEEEYRRDRERMNEELERKIDEIRAAGGSTG